MTVVLLNRHRRGRPLCCPENAVFFTYVKLPRLTKTNLSVAKPVTDVTGFTIRIPYT